MENKSHAMAAGIFVLALLAALAGLAIWLTRDQGSYHTYEMSTAQAVTGLQPQAAVRYKGVNVGKVTHIGFDRQAAGNVLIRITVDDSTPIRPTTYASLGYQGVTGLAYIDLDEAGVSLADLGTSPGGYKRLHMRQSSLSQLAAMGPEVIADVRETMARINQLLSDDNQQTLIGTVERFGTVAQNMTTLTQSVAALTQKVDQSWGQDIAPAIAQLGGDMGRSMKTLEQTAKSIDAMSREIGKVAHLLGQQGGTVDQLGHTAQAFAGAAETINAATLPRLQRTLDEVGAAVKEVGQFVRNLNSNPQSLLYGPNTSRPGPGEKGFAKP